LATWRRSRGTIRIFVLGGGRRRSRSGRIRLMDWRKVISFSPPKSISWG